MKQQIEFKTALQLEKEKIMGELMKYSFEDILELHIKLIKLKDCSANPEEKDKDYIKSNMCRDLVKHFFQKNNSSNSPTLLPRIEGGGSFPITQP